MPLGLSQSESIDTLNNSLLTYTKEQAREANFAFDQAVQAFLYQWIEQSTASSADRSLESEHDIDEFVQHGALRSFFKHYEDALERLLQQDDIARHLLRSSNAVYFEPDAYEPLLAKFEKRIYNLSAHREHLEISFRYSPTSRQGANGDSVGFADYPAGEVREDIGYYFGTRRSDEAALKLLARQLRHEALFASQLPIHVVTDGYMADSLRIVKQTTEKLQEEGEQTLHCFVIQRRHAADDRHLGAALLLMNPQQPDSPERLIFCDTLKPEGQAPWWNTFKRWIDEVFPQPEGQAPVSDRLEDGGVNLQRLHDGVPVRHQDIDCAFYSSSLARTLIQLAKTSPDLIISGSIDDLLSAMTERMPEYFAQRNIARAPELVREVNVIRRWQTGQELLDDLRRSQIATSMVLRSVATDVESTGWSSVETSTSTVDFSSAA